QEQKIIREIDSLNNLPYEYKVANASTLHHLYIKNANVSKEINYLKGEADSYGNLGLIYNYQGKYDKNTQATLKAIELYEKLNDKNKLIATYGGYGYQIKRRDMTKALYYMQKALKLGADSDTEELTPVIDNYGVLKEMLGEHDSAVWYYQKALKRKEKINDEHGIPYSLSKIAGVKLMRKQFDEVKPLLDRAFEIRKKINDRIGIAETYSFYADFYAEQGQNEKAAEYFRLSNEEAKKHKYINLIQYTYNRLSEVFEDKHDFQQALYHFKKHTQFKDSLLNSQTNTKIAELEVEFETRQKEKEILLQRARLAEKNLQLGGAVFLLLFSVLAGYLFWNRQKIKTVQLEKEKELREALLKIETQNRLQEQRLQISRDLHDNIGSQLTFIISSIDNIKFGFSKKDEQLVGKLNNISRFTRDTIFELRDTIWAMNKEYITVEDLKSRVANFINQAGQSASQIDFVFRMDSVLPEQFRFSSQRGMHIYRIIQEAVNNAIKHANPKNIEVSFTQSSHKQNVELTIKDDGTGLSKDTIQEGNGLQNMKKRAIELSGILEINSQGNGTEVKLDFPVTL
ncbi:MAG TPA: ATP-binding protein, partial [Flavobacterium sp.]|nr:ATP-binding protein [Flavobacterium sp.]